MNEIDPFTGPRALGQARSNDNIFLIPTIYFFFYLLPTPKWSSQQPLSWELLIIFSGRELWTEEWEVAGDQETCPWEGLGADSGRPDSSPCVLSNSLYLQKCFYFPSPTPLLPAIIKELWVHCPAITPGASQGTSLSLPFYICNISNSFPT